MSSSFSTNMRHIGDLWAKNTIIAALVPMWYLEMPVPKHCNRPQIPLGFPVSLHKGCTAENKKRKRKREVKNAMLRLGVGSQIGRPDQTASISLWPPVWVCVCLCVRQRESPLPSQTIEQALCLIGVSWWLLRGEDEDKKGGGEVGVVGIRHHCLTCCLDGNREGPKIRWTSESLMKSEKHWGRRWEVDKEKKKDDQRLLFRTPTHILYHLTPGWEVKLG